MFQLQRSGEELSPRSTAKAVCICGEGAPSIDDKIGMLKRLTSADREAVVRQALARLNDLSHTAEEVGALNDQLHQLVDRLSAHPWHVAIFRSWVDVAGKRLARVFSGGEERLVVASPELDASGLGAGETVFLSAELNALMAVGTSRRPSSGQIGEVSEVRVGGDLVVREHDMEVTLERAHWLADSEVSVGDQVLWCPRTRLVFEVGKRAAVPGVRELATEDRDAPPAFAGYEAIRDGSLAGFLCSQKHPESAARYGISPAQGTLLLYGPPGCGKTLLARNLAHELEARFMVIDASSIYSPWVGESEKHLIEAFRQARDSGPAVLFIDEIDAIGRSRGAHTQQHADRVVSVLLTQLEGAAGAPGIAVVGACNRVDLLDPALRSRFGRQFLIPRPDRQALRAIAELHFESRLPYSGERGRALCIERLVHCLSSPNVAGELASLKFRDGRTRSVAVRDMVSGRAVKQIVEAACDRAFRREMSGGAPGIDPRDVEAALEDLLAEWRSTLCVSNVRGYLQDLPDDVDVVSVEQRTSAASSRYLLAAEEAE